MYKPKEKVQVVLKCLSSVKICSSRDVNDKRLTHITRHISIYITYQRKTKVRPTIKSDLLLKIPQLGKIQRRKEDMTVNL